MDNSIIKLEIQGSQLLAVPAIPYRLIFAKHVNLLCRKNETKPDAIAVELGPQSAKNCANWLKELNLRKNFPCMLALTKENNRIRLSFKDLAWKLQETSGKNIEDFSVDELKHLLNYSLKSVIPLSPTDSIIEAIRCSFELNIPLYGIDLEEIADSQREEGKLEDPGGKSGRNLKEYIQRNIKNAEYCRDDEIDERREKVIAARLKTLLKMHKKVLFAGGLTCWGQIKNLIQKSEFRQANVQEISEVPIGKFERCIVHPLLAVYYLDVYPAFAGYYNQYRNGANSSDEFEIREIDITNPMLLFNERLKKICLEYFRIAKSDEQIGCKQEDIQEFPVFLQLLSNLCIVRQKLVPDISTIIEASQSIMSLQFSEFLASEFMKFNWVTNNEFPELAILAPVVFQNSPYMKVEFKYPDGTKSKQFYINLLHNRKSVMSGVSIPWNWDQEKTIGDNRKSEELLNFGELRTWPPRDYLITTMSLDARKIANKRAKNSIQFQGSLLEGIDIKTTMRAFIRGTKQIYVYNKDSRYGDLEESLEYNFDPIVWIFDPYQHKSIESNWSTYAGDILNLNKYVSNPQKLEQISKEKGNSYLAAIFRGKEIFESEDIKRKGINRSILIQGIVYFIPPFFTPQQDGRWLEKYNYEKCPLYNNGKKGLFDSIIKRYGIDFETTDWAANIVRLAIKYAKREVTVIVPDNFTFERIVYEDARKTQIELSIAPLSYFSKENIEKISINYAVYTIAGSNGEKFFEASEIYLKEKVDFNRHLVPKWLLDYEKISKTIAT